MEIFCWNSSYSRSFRFEKGKYNRWNTAWEACFIFYTRHASSPTQFEDLFVFRKWTVLDHKNSGNGKTPSIKFRLLYVIPGNRITILQSVNTTDAHLDFASETSVTNSDRERKHFQTPKMWLIVPDIWRITEIKLRKSSSKYFSKFHLKSAGCWLLVEFC